jgi:hypothetical protein
MRSRDTSRLECSGWWWGQTIFYSGPLCNSLECFAHAAGSHHIFRVLALAEDANLINLGARETVPMTHFLYVLGRPQDLSLCGSGLNPTSPG